MIAARLFGQCFRCDEGLSQPSFQPAVPTTVFSQTARSSLLVPTRLLYSGVSSCRRPTCSKTVPSLLARNSSVERKCCSDQAFSQQNARQHRSRATWNSTFTFARNCASMPCCPAARTCSNRFVARITKELVALAASAMTIKVGAPPDGNMIIVGAKRHHCAKMLFQPSFTGKQASEFRDTSFQSNMRCDVYIRIGSYATAVLSGGTTMFQWTKRFR